MHNFSKRGFRHGRYNSQKSSRPRDDSGNTEGGRRRQDRPPPGLTGREIGMWYAKRSKQRTKVREKDNMSFVHMNKDQVHAANKAIDAVQSTNPDISRDIPLSSVAGYSGQTFVDQSRKLNWFDKCNPDADIDVKITENLNQKLSGNCSENYTKMLKFRQNLPAYKLQKELMEIINSNQVVVISGETGCGKTTQVPQFILDDAIIKGKGLSCKVVCTQPRRISAISVAERVAKERDENCGDGNSTGYQIRLKSKLPRPKASILYCTTGIIVQWLRSDPLLSNVSHVVLDEIHERDLQSDFLISVVKGIVETRKDLKVILMSATLDAEYFSTYFNDCPKFNIPGFTFPVTQYYLEETMNMIRYMPPNDAQQAFSQLNSNKFSWRAKRAGVGREEFLAKQERKAAYAHELDKYEEQLTNSLSKELSHNICSMDAYLQTSLDLNLVVEVIKYIVCHHFAKDCVGGAILIFLPGWESIKKLNTLLTENAFFQPDKYLILPLHSMLPTGDQQRVFDRPPSGVTKIVIATNIAETSITIDDIVYVIDCGKIKVKNFEYGKNINTLEADWVSKANAKQRSGRAGRVQKGYCFHLFTKLQESKLIEYMVPEVLRTPLDQLCLQIKRLGFGKIHNFLSKLLDSPPEESVSLSIQKLTALNALDNEENLTALGYHLSELPVEPQIGKMLLFGAIFSCLSPILTIAGCLSFKDPFVTPLGMEQETDRRRRYFSKGYNSDHIMYVNAFNDWQVATQRGHSAGEDFCWDNFLSSSTLRMLKDMRSQFSNYLFDAGFLTSSSIYHDSANLHSDNMNVVQAIVCSALYPNVAKLMPKNPRAPPKICTNVERRVFLHPKSVNNRKMSQDFHHQWLCYYEKMRTSEVKLYDTTEVSPFPLLFFGGKIKSFVDDQGTEMISVDDWITFKAKGHIADTVKKLRLELDKLLKDKIKQPQWATGSPQKAVLESIVDLISRD